MKSLPFFIILLLPTLSIAQSPGLTINIIMDSAKVDGTRFKIEMKMCKPKKMTERGDWFTHDTSTIDFAALKVNDIECRKYFDKGIGEPLTYDKEKVPFNKFIFSNQVFAWENIFVFRISDWSSQGWNPEMYIVIPIKYKSFLTHIDITDIEFLSGKCVFLTEANAFYDEKKLNMRQSLKDQKGIEVKDFALKELLKEK
jgi:hypothetical protein